MQSTMTNRPIALAVLRHALGYAGDYKNYQARLALGFEFCRRWLEQNHDYHGLDLDEGVLLVLRDLCNMHSAFRNMIGSTPRDGESLGTSELQKC